MGLRTLLVLVLIVAGLGAVLWFTDEKPSAQKVAETAVLDGRSLTTAKTIRWQFVDRPPIELGRDEHGRLRITEPIVDLVSAAYLRQIVVAWDSAQMKASPLADTEENRVKVGVAAPELVFDVAFDDGKNVHVEIGGVGPLEDRETRYVRRDGKLWVASAALVESLRVGLEELREPAVFAHAPIEVSELRVEQHRDGGKTETWHLKRVNNEWRLLAPVEGRADPVAAERFVTSVMSLRVSAFASGATQLPPGEPAIVIEAKGPRGTEALSLWDQQGQLVGELPARKIVFASDNSQFTSIFTNATDALRARVLLPMEGTAFHELVEFVVDPGQGRGDRIRLVRDSAASNWRIVEPIEFPAGATPCNEAAQVLQTMFVQEFVDEPVGAKPRANEPRFGLAPGKRLTVTARASARGNPMTLWLGAPVQRGDQALAYVCRADEPDTIVLVPQAHVDTLARPWTAYCELQVMRQPATVERLDFVRGGTTITYQIQDKQWVREGQPGARSELHDIANDMLRDLRGTKAVDARGPEFAQGDWTVKLMRVNEDELGVLHVWDRGGDTPLLVQRDGQRGVAFEIKALVSKQLRALCQ